MQHAQKAAAAQPHAAANRAPATPRSAGLRHRGVDSTAPDDRRSVNAAAAHPRGAWHV